MVFSYARVASCLGLRTHRAAVSLALEEQTAKQTGRPPRRFPWSHNSLFCFSLVLLCTQAQGQISLVNVTPCGPGSFPGAACAVPATGSGHLIVVGIQVGSGANTATTISSITDNVGNAYFEAGGARSIDTAAGSVVDIWYAKNSAAGGNTLNINPTANIQNAGVVVWEFSGTDPNAPLDQAAALNSQASSANPLGAPVTLQSANEVVIGLAAVSGVITGIFSGNAFTSDSTLKQSGWTHLITSAAGSYSPQWVANPPGTYSASTVSFIAAVSGSGVDPCDLNDDGVVNILDANLAVSMSLGQAPCTANIDGNDVCNVVVVQRVVNAANGGTCVTGNSHDVSLSWTASTSPNVAGYNVFRGLVSGGPYTQLNSALVPAVTYSDNDVEAAQTYYYVTTAVDNNNNSSVFSNEASAVIPSP